MISSVQNVNSTLNTFGRTINPGARNPAGSGIAESGVARVVDKVDSNASVGVELPQGALSQSVSDQLEKMQANELDENLAEETANLVAQKASFRSGIAVLKTADRMVGTLLDVIG